MEINGDSVAQLYVDVLWWARVAKGEVEESRVGKCKTLEEPLTICNRNPRDRVLTDFERNANPFFHLFEAIWMVAGANDNWIVQFNKQMGAYMDYGSFHGAYGYRWAGHFGFDQVERVIDMLKETPNTRRAYISLWSPTADLGQTLKDLPCNVGMAFQMRNGRLNGYVFNRSNDLIWGMMGTNCVHFAFLLEVVSDCSGIPLGHLYQQTINPHLYDRHWGLLAFPVDSDLVRPDPRALRVQDYPSFVADCKLFLKIGGEGMYEHPWFNEVAAPMYQAYVHRDPAALRDIKAADLNMSCRQWWGRNRAEKTT